MLVRSLFKATLADGPLHGLSVTCAYLTCVSNVYLLIKLSHAIHCFCQSIARISNPTVKNLMPLRNTFQETFPQAQSVASLGIAVGSAIATIEDISIRSLNSQTQPDLAHTDVLVSLTRDTWSRAARRKKANSTVMQTDPQSQPLMGTALICRITCVEAEHDSGAGRTRLGGPIIRFDWVRGRERALFESFVNHVERKVTALLTSNSALM